MRANQDTAKGHANRARKRAMRRARKWLSQGQPSKADRVLARGEASASLREEGKHPLSAEVRADA